MLDGFVVVIGLAGACALGLITLNLKSESSAALSDETCLTSFENINMRDAREYLLISDTHVC